MWIEKIMTLHLKSSPPNYLVKAFAGTIIWKCGLRGCGRQSLFLTLFMLRPSLDASEFRVQAFVTARELEPNYRLPRKYKLNYV